MSDRSPLFCQSLNRKARPCSKLGHYAAEGRRYCRSHLPEGAVKDPIRCEDRLADDSQCISMAEQLLEVGPRCHFHARRFLEGETPVERQRRALNGDGVTAAGAVELDLDGLELDAVTAGTIRQRLVGVAHDLFPAASGVLADALKAEKYEPVTCPHCGKKHRHLTKDMGTRLAALKILLDRTSAAPTSAPDEPPPRYADEPDYEQMTTAELRRLAFPKESEES